MSFSRGQRGQALIVFILAMSVMFLVGAITVDVGLWLSERRGSQKDADVSALAGAWELIDPTASGITAQNAADAALTDNDQQANASFVSQPDVDLDSRCVSVDVRHDSRALFFSLFGLGKPDIGAHAKACAGAANAPGNLVPFYLAQDVSPCFAGGQPNFTQLCWIAGGAHKSNARGILDLEAEPYCSNVAGSGDLENLIENGAKGLCLINQTDTCAGGGQWYDCVHGQSGNPNNPKIIGGTNARVSRDGLCDAEYGDGDGIDDFSETVQVTFDTGDPRTSIYTPRDCDPSTPGTQISPRLVTIVVTATNPGSNGVEPILAFAGVYLAGCVDEGAVNPTLADLDPYCGEKQVSNMAPAINPDDLYVSALVPAPLAAPRRTLTVKLSVSGPDSPGAFAIHVDSTGNPVPDTFPGSSAGTNVLIDNNTQYDVAVQSGPAGYAYTYSSGCDGKVTGGGATCTITATKTTPTPTPVATPTPTPTGGPATPPPPTPTPTPQPTSNPQGCGAVGHCSVYGQLVNIIYGSGGIGPITDQTTAFGIALVE